MACKREINRNHSSVDDLSKIKSDQANFEQVKSASELLDVETGTTLPFRECGRATSQKPIYLARLVTQGPGPKISIQALGGPSHGQLVAAETESPMQRGHRVVPMKTSWPREREFRCWSSQKLVSLPAVLSMPTDPELPAAKSFLPFFFVPRSPPTCDPHTTALPSGPPLANLCLPPLLRFQFANSPNFT